LGIFVAEILLRFFFGREFLAEIFGGSFWGFLGFLAVGSFWGFWQFGGFKGVIGVGTSML
jgi:hypothetical protein